VEGPPFEEDVGLVDEQYRLPGAGQVERAAQTLVEDRAVGSQIARRNNVQRATRELGDALGGECFPLRFGSAVASDCRRRNL